MAEQLRADDHIELERADFFARNEPNASWSHAVSDHMLLPALRGFWPMSAHHVTIQSAYVDDIACGFDIGMINSPSLQLWNGGLPPCCLFVTASSEYLSLGVDDIQFDILGTEQTTLAAQRGLTLGTWIRFTAMGNLAGIIDKWTSVGNQCAYRLYKSAANAIIFEVTTDGSTVVGVTSTATIVQDTWYHVVARFVPSTTLDIYVDAVRTSNLAGIPASIFNSTAILRMACSDGTNYLNGYMSLAWIAASITWDGAGGTRDVIPWALFEHSKRMYNK